MKEKKIPDDPMFVIQISENMELRNSLRSGLVQAQNRDNGKIPLFVSWPQWLDDGIVCMYARDFRNVMMTAIREAALSVNAESGNGGDGPNDGGSTGSSGFQGLDAGILERIDSPD